MKKEIANKVMRQLCAYIFEEKIKMFQQFAKYIQTDDKASVAQRSKQ